MKPYKTLRRGQSENGFTLIELLVVILIIAILAAVGIVALLSALNAGRKSAATTVLRNGISAVRAWQSSQGQTNFTGLTTPVMEAAEPDITWGAKSDVLPAGGNTLGLYTDPTTAIIASQSEKGICYYARLYANPTGSEKSTMYASKVTPASPGCRAVDADDVTTWYPTPKAGWNL